MNSEDRDWLTTKALLQHFEDEWVAGNNPDLEEYLNRVPVQDQGDFLAAIAHLRAEGMPRNDATSPIERSVRNNVAMGIGMLIVTAFGALLAFAPNLWAAVIAAGFVLVSGQLLTRVVLSMPGSRQQWCWSIVTGFALLGFFWVIVQLMK